MRTVLAVSAFALITGDLGAQPLAPPPPAPLAPNQVIANPLPVALVEPPLPGGKDVSQPLQPVGPVAIDPPPPVPVPVAPTVKAIPPERPHGPLGPAWDDIQLLYWWPERPHVPPLVLGSRSGPPVPGQNDTRVLAGGRAFDSQPSAGGRFTFG